MRAMKWGRVASPSVEKLGFRRDINGLRALAVLGVVAFHADRTLAPGGFAGVDVFFVISGFLISRIILTECAAGDFSLAMFYAKRARRILPALLVAVSCVWVAGWFFSTPSQFRDIGGGTLGNSYFTVNFWLLRLPGIAGYFGPDSSTRPLLHLWSLSIEEQFYLVWSVVLLGLHRLAKRLTPRVILGIFFASLAACVVLTPIDPIAAFYLPWARAWELALGALLAYREVHLMKFAPYRGRLTASVGAGVGVALILGAYALINEAEPFPGWRALVPTVGCALVIGCPRSLPGDLLLGNRVAGFFGVISYPLYLWHWPLFAFAHSWPGVVPTHTLMLALAALAVLLATLTRMLAEVPVAALFRHRPFAVALALAAVLAVTGVVGRVTYAGKGFPNRYPPLVQRVFDYDVGGMQGKALLKCFYGGDRQSHSLDEEREQVARFFAEGGCGKANDPKKPTILLVGDSHAAHLFAGLTEAFAGKANVATFSSVFCAPLVEHVAMDAGIAGTPRCRAINDYVFERIREVKPDVLLVAGYYAQYDHDGEWRYPGYFDALVAGARRLHQDGVPSIVIAGEVPTWAPDLRVLVGRDLLERPEAPMFSTFGVRADSLETDRTLAAEDWGQGVTYVSQAERLCGADGCRRLVGQDLPDDLLAVDYGHYSLRGSIFAVKTILAPVIEAEIAKQRR
jgi:peptidoglycan/LPS O-acetylase OafA/YrhL